ncbi:MAG: GNAT family N-acetyltransferase [Pseudomonadota bacterium]
MLALGQGIGLVAPRSDQPADGALVATALTVPLGERLAWISMVLVEAAWRRRGLGTRLLQRCYRRIVGTRRDRRARMRRRPAAWSTHRSVFRRSTASRACSSSRPRTHPWICRATSCCGRSRPPIWRRWAPWDAARSLMRRDPLLADLQHRLPAAAWLATRADRIAGFRARPQWPVVEPDRPDHGRRRAGRAGAARRRAARDAPRRDPRHSRSPCRLAKAGCTDRAR